MKTNISNSATVRGNDGVMVFVFDGINRPDKSAVIQRMKSACAYMPGKVFRAGFLTIKIELL